MGVIKSEIRKAFEQILSCKLRIAMSFLLLLDYDRNSKTLLED